jgi:hypothetical protein
MMYTISILSTPSSIIGTIGINRWNSLFYMLHPSHWNQGYCTEALKAFLRELWKHSPKRLTLSAAVIEGNTASQRVLEKCEFKKWDGWRHEEQHTKNPRSSAPTQEEEEGQRSEDEESIEVDAIIVDNDGKRRLSKIEAEELINAIEGLKVQTKPAIEPIRVDSVRPAPRKQAKLIIFRYERKLATDEVLDV